MWVNGKRAGERIWAPFRLDVSEYLCSGSNALEIAARNSDANRRAQARMDCLLPRKKLNLMPNIFAYMDSIHPNGLIGPVRLIPYNEVELDLSR